MSEHVQIKTYEPIDDQALFDLVSGNLFHYQSITSKMLIEGAIAKYGYPKIAIFLSCIYLALYILLGKAGIEGIQAQLVTIIIIVSVLGLLYGFIFPKIMTNYDKKYQAALMKKEFSDIKRNYGGPGRHFWIATIKTEKNPAKERIVGCVLVEPYDIKRDFIGLTTRTDIKGEIAELRRMSVDSSMRRLGIGRKLMSELKSFCQKHGYGAIALTTLSSNKVAIQAYKSSGYEFWKKLCVKQAPLPFTVASLVMKL